MHPARRSFLPRISRRCGPRCPWADHRRGHRARGHRARGHRGEIPGRVEEPSSFPPRWRRRFALRQPAEHRRELLIPEVLVHTRGQLGPAVIRGHRLGPAVIRGHPQGRGPHPATPEGREVPRCQGPDIPPDTPVRARKVHRTTARRAPILRRGVAPSLRRQACWMRCAHRRRKGAHSSPIRPIQSSSRHPPRPRRRTVSPSRAVRETSAIPGSLRRGLLLRSLPSRRHTIGQATPVRPKPATPCGRRPFTLRPPKRL